MSAITPNQDFPPSLWNATAPPAPHTPPLSESIDTDVLVVGGGFTGLSTALHLAEQGVKVCVLEAAQPGWGASGRNGGQVIPGLKYDPDELVQRFGNERGEALAKAAGGAADVVFDLIDKYDIQCDAVRKGWIQTAHSPAMLKTLIERAQQWEKRGTKVSILDEAAVRERVGAEGRYVGGWIDHRAGSVQPLAYTRGLAGAALSLGASVHGNSAVTSLSKTEGGWRATTSQGAIVKAGQVVIATNAYSDDLWPQLRKTVLAANSFVIATEPLPDSLGKGILDGGEVTSNSRRLLVYYRRDRAGRLVLGGRGPFTDPNSASEWAHIERAMGLLFPRLKNVGIEYRWAGRLAITADFLPHYHEPAPGLSIALGYNGRGVAMATTMGKLIAKRITGVENDFPFSVSPIKTIPMHGLNRFYLAAGVAWYRFLDSLS